MPVKEKVFRKLTFITRQGTFTLNGKLYKQIDGVTMKNPTRSYPSKHFFGHLEKRLFEKLYNKDVLPKLYLLYVDDVYAVFYSQNSCSKFSNLLNS